MILNDYSLVMMPSCIMFLLTLISIFDVTNVCLRDDFSIYYKDML